MIKTIASQWAQLSAVIFDFDGVILESADIKTDAFLELFADYPQHRDAIRGHHLDNLGISRFRKFEWIYQELLGEALSPTKLARLGDTFAKIVLDKVLSCPFVPGALEALRALQEHVPLFVASGTPHEELGHIVSERGLNDFFQGVWGSPRAKVDIISEVLAVRHVDAERVWFVGDGVSDYEAAKSAGVQFVARTTPPLREMWERLDVMRVSDLHELAAVAVAARLPANKA